MAWVVSDGKGTVGSYRSLGYAKFKVRDLWQSGSMAYLDELDRPFTFGTELDEAEGYEAETWVAAAAMGAF